MTRLSRIRTMSAEELAKIIIDHDVTDAFCRKEPCPFAGEDCNPPDEECLKCCVGWLEEEVPNEL